MKEEKKEKLLLGLINDGSVDEMVIYTLIQEILGLDDTKMKLKINALRKKFIDMYKTNGSIKGWY